MKPIPAPQWFPDSPEAWRLASASALLRKRLRLGTGPGADAIPFGTGFAFCVACAALALAFTESLLAPLAVFVLARGAWCAACGFAAKASLRFAYNARWSLRSDNPELGFEGCEKLLDEAARAPELSPEEQGAALALCPESGGYGPFAMHDRAFYKRLRNCRGPAPLNLAEKTLLAGLDFPLRAAGRRQCPKAAQSFLLRACPKLACQKQRSELDSACMAPGCALPRPRSAL